MTAISCYDPDLGCVTILGGGPAGMSAALWSKHLGFSPLIIETNERLGGMQQLNFLRNDWVLGQTGLNGPALAAKFAQHMADEHIPIERACTPLAIKKHHVQFSLTFRKPDGAESTAHCRAIVIATGLHYRAAEVIEMTPGFRALTAKDVAYGPYAFLEMERLRGKAVLIVGCGDNAFENAKMLLAQGARVTLLCRSRPRAQTCLREAVLDSPALHGIFERARIERFERGAEAIDVSIESAGRSIQLQVQKIHVLAGYAPNTRFLDEVLDPALPRPRLDAAGYLVVDAWGRTTSPGIYAAGDVCNPDFPNVVSAIASGAKAAKAIEQDFRRTP